MAGNEAPAPRARIRCGRDAALRGAAVGDERRSGEGARHELDDDADGSGENDEIRALERGIHRGRVGGVDEPGRQAFHGVRREHRGAIHADDFGVRPRRAQRERNGPSNQAQAGDDDVHRRTAAPTARTRSASSTASAQRNVAGTRAISPSRPTHVRRMTPSAPAATAAHAAAAT